IGAWTHVALIRTEAGNELYINGVLEAIGIGGGFFATDEAYIGLWEDETEISHYFRGQIDEVTLDLEITSGQEIQQLMHWTGFGNEIQWQFNQTLNLSGVIETYDFASSLDIARSSGGVTLVPSTVNTGNDATNLTEAETLSVSTAPSTITFNFANLAIDIQSLTLAEDFTVTNQFYLPNDTTQGIIAGDEVISSPTWVINKSDSLGAFVANVTFLGLNLSSISSNPLEYVLYRRDLFSEGAWMDTGLAASSVSASAVTFVGLDQVGQYLIAFRPLIVNGALTLSEDSLLGFQASTSLSSGLQNFQLDGFDLIGDIQAIAPSGFEISFSVLPFIGFQNSLTIPVINDTLVNRQANFYVRLQSGLGAGAYEGFILFQDAGVTLDSIFVQGQVLDPVTPFIDASRGAALLFVGDSSSLGLTQTVPRPETFTVEAWVKTSSPNQQMILGW
ncbi:MAG: hypothetical protein AAFU64_15105, partial [Bacteroidota bacterium]